MDMYDFFFPEQAEASHLRRISSSLSRATASTSAAAHTARQAVDEVAELRTDVRFLSMVLAAILKRLAESETMSLSDVTDLLDDIDRLDGQQDSGLDPGVLRGILGVVKQEASQPAESSGESIEIRTTPQWQRRFRR